LCRYNAGAEGAERAKSILPTVLARLLGGRTPGPAGAADILRACFTETDEAGRLYRLHPIDPYSLKAPGFNP
jgi:hypothetical protein